MQYKCSLCGRKVDGDLAVFVDHTETHVIDEIKAKHPDWVEENGMCQQCLDYYKGELKGKPFADFQCKERRRIGKKFLKTDNSLAPFFLRIMLGLVMLPHGFAKVMPGVFGGGGFTATINFFTGQGMPWAIAFLVIVGESLGSLGLIFGFLTRFCAFSFIMIMLGAVQMVHFQHGFFMNWSGTQAGEGFEYHILVIGMCLSLMITGAGRWSVDGVLSKEEGSILKRKS